MMKIPKFTFKDSPAIHVKLWDSDLKLILRALDAYAEQLPPHKALRVDDVKRVLTWDL